MLFQIIDVFRWMFIIQKDPKKYNIQIKDILCHGQSIDLEHYEAFFSQRGRFRPDTGQIASYGL
jgi:hypothetical protein